jgi:hypothetical protein
VDTRVEWSGIATDHLQKEGLDILGQELRSWIGPRRAKPNRIRILVESPVQPVLDNSEFRMCIGNSDYFTIHTITNLSRRSYDSNNGEPIGRVLDSSWSAPALPFGPSAVPYHISAHGVLFVTDPQTDRTYLVLTLPSRQRVPIAPGWNATFAEQMWAPSEETPRDPWWQPYATGLTIEPPQERTGDQDLWRTVLRGMTEELGVQEADLSSRPKLVAACIEQDMYAVAFIFVLRATLTLAELHKRRLGAPDREIGLIAAFPIAGTREGGGRLDSAAQFATLLSMERFDGGPYLLSSPSATLVEPWHLSARLRIHAAARHCEGNRFLDYVCPR